MLMGSSPMVVEAGQPCDHHGAMAMDEVDGDLTSRVVDSGMTNTFIVGTGQSITYSVTNNVGMTSQVVRRVHIVDTIDGCADRPCFPHGTCTDAVESFICTCDRYYTGEQCETRQQGGLYAWFVWGPRASSDSCGCLLVRARPCDHVGRRQPAHGPSRRSLC